MKIELTEPCRQAAGIAFFENGFRPFFLGAGIWASVSMALWIAIWTGHFELPGGMDPVSWHAHEFLFGYAGAVIAGFLLTAVPNWTGRLPTTGWPLAGLFAVWIAGRLAILLVQGEWPVATAIVDVAFPVLLGILMAREILASGNRKNLPVLAVFAIMTVGNILFHVELNGNGFAAGGPGERIAVSAVIMLIALIGGRVVPSFTRNWLARRDPTHLPAPVGRFDAAALLILAAALAAWSAFPEAIVTGILLFLAGFVNLGRLARWQGMRTGAEPLVWILHAAYVFVPLGAIAAGCSVLFPDIAQFASPLHLWLAGAIGLMTLAVMTRASLGHTGRELHAGAATTAIYLLVIGSVLTRFMAGFLPAAAGDLLAISAMLWIGGFGCFVLTYGPMLCRRRQRA
ncbi:MAG: NnrS family protein [Rhodospirillales bacterium]